MRDRCHILRCRADADMTYLGHGVCTRHWNELTNDNVSVNALRMALGLAPEPELLSEDTMPSKKKKQTIGQPAAETPQIAVTDAPEKKTKLAKAKTATKPEKKKREPNEKMRTVALRVPEADFQLLHKAAGDRQLANFMRTTLLDAAEKALSK